MKTNVAEGLIAITTTTLYSVEQIMAEVKKSAKHILEPVPLQHHKERKYEDWSYGAEKKDDWFDINDKLYTSDVKEAYNNVEWMKAGKVFVPYNEDLMRTCAFDALKAYCEDSFKEWFRDYRNETPIEKMAVYAIFLYRNSDYYKTTYRTLLLELRKEMDELYKPSEMVVEINALRNELKALKRHIWGVAQDIHRMELPASATKTLKRDIDDLKHATLRYMTEPE